MIVVKDGRCYLLDRHLAAVEGAKEEATLQLRNFYKVWEKVVYECLDFQLQWHEFIANRVYFFILNCKSCTLYFLQVFPSTLNNI